MKTISLFLRSLCVILFCFVSQIAFAQPNFSKNFSPSTIGPGSASELTFIIDNTGSGTPVTNLSFVDNLPAGVILASPANAVSDCIGAVLSAPDGGGTITLSNGSVAAFSSCSITVQVTSSVIGTHMNLTGDLTSSAGNSGTATANLTVDANRPGFSKSFSPSSLDLGERSTLTFIVDNTANPNNIFLSSFTDNLPAGVVVASPSNATCSCGNTSAITATPGSSVIIFNDFSLLYPINSGASCTVTVDVEAAGIGSFVNTTSNLGYRNNFGQNFESGKATDEIEVVNPGDLLIEKTFLPNPVNPGEMVDLEFTITNFSRDFDATAVSFTDDLNAALMGLAATGTPLSDVCGTGSTLSGTTSISLTGGQIPASSSCTFTVSLQVPAGATPGTYTNTTSAVSGTINGSPVTGNDASENLFIANVPTFTKTFLSDPILSGGSTDLEFTITNTNTTGAITDMSFNDNIGAFLSGATVSSLPAAGSCGAGSIFFTFIDSGQLTFSMNGGQLPASGSCTFTITIQTPDNTPPGTYNNVTTPLNYTDGTPQVGVAASEDLEILPVAEMTKTFLNDPVDAGATVDLEFTISLDALAPTDATAINFTDDLNAMLSGATALGLPLNDVCGTGSTLSGASTISLTGGTLSPDSDCTFTVTVQVPAGALPGNYTNTTSAVSSTVSGLTGTSTGASDVLTIGGLTLTKEFIENPALQGTETTLRFTIDNTTSLDATNIIFFDNLNDMLTGAQAVLLPQNDICGPGSSISGTSNLTFSGGNVTAGSSCTFDVIVDIPSGAANGSYSNLTSNLIATLGGSILVLDPASDVLEVNNELIQITKEFTDDPVLPGDNVTVEFTLTNLDPNWPAESVAFTTDFGAAIPGATLVGLPSMECNGTVADLGGGLMDFSGGLIPAGGSCTFSVTLQIPASTPYGAQIPCTTSTVTGVIGDGSDPITGTPASDILQTQLLQFTKTFLSSPVDASNTVDLEFTITNPDAASNINSINFSDDLNAFIVGATATNLPLNDVCGTGSMLSGGSTVSLTGASLGPDESCTFIVTVDIPCGTLGGTYTNTTSTISATGSAGSIDGEPATDDLVVNAAAPATFTAPADVTIECDESSLPTNTGTVSNIMHSCCTSGLVASYTDVTNLSGCSMTGSISRSWVVTDCNGVTSSAQVQVITVVDSNAPTIVCPADVTIQCDGGFSVNDTGNATATDNCDAMPSVTNLTIFGNSEDGSCSDFTYDITRTFTATDACGNSSSCTQIIAVVDDTAPSITCPPTVTIQCDESTSSANTGVATAMDNCDPAIMVVESDVSTQIMDGSCSEFSYTITRTFSVSDACENSNSCSQVITVVDDTAPTISCPNPTTVQCDESTSSADTGTATAMDNCDASIMVMESDVSTQIMDGSCSEFSYTITRTFSVSDVCGNSNSCSQVISVVDNTAPTINCPSSTTVQCDESTSSADTGTATAMDNCDASIMVMESDASTQIMDGSCSEFSYTITRTFSVSDVCGNSNSCSQVISVIDDTAPIINCPSSTTVQCDESTSSADTGTATAMDNCDASIMVMESDVSTQTMDGSCSEFSYTITRTFSVSDVCGNSNSCSQVISVVDDTAPTINCPSSTTVQCDESTSSADTGTATAMDNCDASIMVMESDASTQTTDGSCTDYTYTITRTFSVSDVCGNSNSCSQTISVVDDTAPTAVCNSLTVTLMSGMYTFSTGDIATISAGSSDNCDSNISLVLDRTDLDCTDAPGTTVVLTVSDACGNSSTCSAAITVIGGAPVVDAGTYDDVCENGEDVVLTGSPSPVIGETAIWSGPGVTDASNADAFASFDPSGLSGSITLTYTLTTAEGCVEMASTDILVNDTPVCSASNEGPICEGDNLALMESGGDGIDWAWEGPNGFNSTAQNPVIMNATPLASGTYTVTVTDENGCTSICSTEATVFPNPVITASECFCDYDPLINNFGSQVILTVDSGTGPYTLSTSDGTLSETVLNDGESSTLFIGSGGGSYTVDVVDANGCVTSISNFCEGCGFEASIDDPCSCNNDQSYNGSGDGTFGEQVIILGPPGLTLIVGAGSQGLLGFAEGDLIPEVAPGIYRINFDHIDRQGYELFVEGMANGNRFPLRDSNGDQVQVSNNCQYPIITEPELDMVDFCNNESPLVFTGDEIEEINGFEGTVQVYLGGVSTGTPISEFDPSQYPNGYYTLTFLFTGDFINNQWDGIDPAFPGCQTQTNILIGVGGGGSLTCNDHVNMTVNTNCELDFSWSTLMEADNIPNVFSAQFHDAAGNEIAEDDLGSYIGNTVTYSIIDDCTGNYCWGTISIEDKNDPVIDCEICPPINGSSAADYDPDCVLNCYEQPILQLRYDDGLRDDLVQEDYEDFVEDAMTDNCDNWDEEDVSFYDDWTSLGACVGTRLTRTWTVGFRRADGSRGTVSCTREYFFRPLDFSRVTGYALDPLGNPIFEAKEDSLVVPPEVIELPCGVDLSPAGIAAFFDDPTTVDRDTDDNNIDPDELDVDLVVENNEGIRWAYPHYYQDGVGSGGPHAQAINNEACNIIVGYTDSEIDACAVGCDGNRKVLRNWTVLDWCTGQFITYGQIIKSIDQNPPFLTVPDVTASVDPWECVATVNLPHPEHIGDDCDANVTYYIGNRNGFDLSGDAENGFVLTGVPLGSYEIEYLAEDCCGNVGRTTMTITVVDNTPPVAVSKEFIVLSLTNIGNQVDEFQGVAKLYAEDVDNGSYDGCTDVTFEVRRTPVCDPDDAEWGPFVTFCCEDLNGGTDANIDVELKITDEYGNENIVWATVLLEDKSATIPVIPPHMFLTCDMDYNNLDMTGGIPRFFGACGEAEIDCDTLEVYESTEPRELRASDGVFIDGIGPIEAPAYDPSCGFGAIRRQFRGCGDGIQWFVILPVDPFDPTTIVWPDDVVVDCDDYEVGEPSWEEATCNLVGISMEADTFYFEDGACYKILNHWSVINWCIYDPSNPSAGGRYEHVQEVKIIDTVDPVLTVADSLCFAVDGNCLSSNVSLSGSAVDDGDCASDWISWDVSIDAYSDWSEDFHYATTNPRLLPNGEPNPYHIPKTGNGVDATITLPDGIPSSKIWHRAVWRAYDGCGNTSSVTTYFQIVDKKAPTPYCLNLSTAVMSNGQVELWAIDFNVGSFDNCTDSENLLFTFTDVPPPPRDDTEYDSNDDLMWYNGTFWYYNSEDIDPDTGAGEYEGQDDYGGEVHRWEPGLRSAGKVFTAADADASGFAQVPIYVWDECGNIDFCMVNLRIVDNGGGGMAMVSGKVATEFGAEVEQVVTEMEGSLNFRDTDVTDAQGEYAFANTPFYADYQVSGEKNDDYLNGVSTLDLIMIQRHIIGIEALDSPYKMIAADVNNDNSISAVDLIELRKLILGIYDELPENGSWKFVNADNTLDVNDPFSYSETRAIEDLASDMMAEDFIGVKIGDVNESVVANARTQSTEVSNKASVVKMSYEDKQVEEGDIVEINLSTDRADVYGYQFTLNTAGMELVDVQGLDADHVAVFENMLTVSHNSLTAIDQNDVVTLVMRAKTDASVSELMTIGSELTRAEAYVGEDLEVVSIDLRDSREDAVFALYQNEPNPFADYTLIGFELPQAGQATITMYDVTGKVLNVIQGQYERGYNSVKVTKEDIGVSGMLIYQLEFNGKRLMKNMVVLK